MRTTATQEITHELLCTYFHLAMNGFCLVKNFMATIEESVTEEIVDNAQNMGIVFQHNPYSYLF